MKKILFAIMLMTPVLGSAETPKLNPADYTVAVHVQASQLVTVCHDFMNRTICEIKQHLSVAIDGKKYELNSKDNGNFVLRTGDYKARLLGIHPRFPVVSQDYETYYASTSYEFLFPDGKTRKYTVVGVSE